MCLVMTFSLLPLTMRMGSNSLKKPSMYLFSQPEISFLLLLVMTLLCVMMIAWFLMFMQYLFFYIFLCMLVLHNYCCFIVSLGFFVLHNFFCYATWAYNNLAEPWTTTNWVQLWNIKLLIALKVEATNYNDGQSCSH